MILNYIAMNKNTITPRRTYVSPKSSERLMELEGLIATSVQSTLTGMDPNELYDEEF